MHSSFIKYLPPHFYDFKSVRHLNKWQLVKMSCNIPLKPWKNLKFWRRVSFVEIFIRIENNLFMSTLWRIRENMVKTGTVGKQWTNYTFLQFSSIQFTKKRVLEQSLFCTTCLLNNIQLKNCPNLTKQDKSMTILKYCPLMI